MHAQDNENEKKVVGVLAAEGFVDTGRRFLSSCVMSETGPALTIMTDFPDGKKVADFAVGQSLESPCNVQRCGEFTKEGHQYFVGLNPGETWVNGRPLASRGLDEALSGVLEMLSKV